MKLRLPVLFAAALAALSFSCTTTMTILKCGGPGGEHNFAQCTWRKTSIFSPAFRRSTAKPVVSEASDAARDLTRPDTLREIAAAPLRAVVAPLAIVAGTVSATVGGREPLPGGDCTQLPSASSTAYSDCVMAQVRYLNSKPSWRAARWLRSHILGEGGSQGR